jgi:hypothetical protein
MTKVRFITFSWIVFITTLIIFIAILLIYLINANRLASSDQLNNSAAKISSYTQSTMSYTSLDNEGLSQAEETLDGEYFYNASYITQKFSIKYPKKNWDVSFCEASGCWDVNIQKKDYQILIDLSGEGDVSFEDSLNNWINNWGNYNYKYTYKVLSEGLTDNNKAYKLYRVTEENGNNYLFALVEVTQVSGSRGLLAIKFTNINNIDFLNTMVRSINHS